jgi:hypothetical protein
LARFSLSGTKPVPFALMVYSIAGEGHKLPLLPLNKDPQLGRFWTHRGEDGIKREK